MGITGLIPFLEKASKRANIGEFSGCTVAIDSYCWLHKGAFACADKLVRGEETDIHIKYCLKYVTMLLSKNVKPILVFDGRHLPAKAMTEAKRRESRDISKKRAAELLSLGKIEEARSYMRRSVDITHAMALSLIKECRKRNVDCIVAPYEADAQLAYLNINNYAQIVITEDSDLTLFGCTKVLFKMDLDGAGTLVDTSKLPLVMKCPIEHYSFDKFRQMCIMSGCDYLASLPGIGLAKARQFVTATQDPNFANALRKLPSFFNRANLTVTDEYRENFLKAEATFKYQYVYDPQERRMVRLNDTDDDDTEQALCGNAGELLESNIAFQLALGNLDPFSLKKMDDWHPDRDAVSKPIKTDSWKEVASHPSIWSKDFTEYLSESCPWQKKIKKVEPIIAAPKTRKMKKVVNLVSKVVPETQDESLTIEALSSMYCAEPVSKRLKTDSDTGFSQDTHNIALTDEDINNELTQKPKSPILENKDRTFRKSLKNRSLFALKRLSKFPRTIVDSNIVESKFFSTNAPLEENVEISQDKNKCNTNNKSLIIEESPERVSRNPFKIKSSISPENIIKNDNIVNNEVMEVNKNSTSVIIEESPERVSRNPFKIKSSVSPENVIKNEETSNNQIMEMDTECVDLVSSQKENALSPFKKEGSPILEPSPRSRTLFRSKLDSQLDGFSEDSVVENTYPLEKLVTPVGSQSSFGASPRKAMPSQNSMSNSQPLRSGFTGPKKSTCRVPGLKRTQSVPSNQPTLLSKFGFQKKPALKR